MTKRITTLIMLLLMGVAIAIGAGLQQSKEIPIPKGFEEWYSTPSTADAFTKAFDESKDAAASDPLYSITRAEKQLIPKGKSFRMVAIKGSIATATMQNSQIKITFLGADGTTTIGEPAYVSFGAYRPKPDKPEGTLSIRFHQPDGCESVKLTVVAGNLRTEVNCSTKI